MKKFLVAVGGVAFLAIVAYLFYFSLQARDALFLYLHRDEFAQKWRQASEKAQAKAVANAQDHLQQIHRSIASAPSFFVDPDGYGTEDNWIGSTISREIAGMAFVIVHPQQPLPDFAARAHVDPDKPAVHVSLANFGDRQPVSADLTPAFAWDGPVYAPLAEKLLTPAASQSASPAAKEPDILATLLDLTGQNLAKEDIRLSGNLQQNPASWPDHEAGALALAGLALRENDRPNYDIRNLLSRATAHLAMAEALRGRQPETWPGLVADAAVRTLSGREADALAHLDALAARPDCPASAKAWIASLRLIARQDWRVAQPTPDSPLLLKIAWFQVLNHNIRGTTATAWLEKIMPPPPDDPTAPSASDSPWGLPDWGRAVTNNTFLLQVDSGHRFTENNITLEYRELNQILAVEGGAPVSDTNLVATFSVPEDQTVTQDAQGRTVIRVIGPGTFKAAARRHLYHTMRSTYFWMLTDLGLRQDADDFRARMDSLYRGAPLWYFTFAAIDGSPDPESINHRNQQWAAEGVAWNSWDVDPFWAIGIPGEDVVKAFYAHGVPFGTAYAADVRIDTLNLIGVKDYTAELMAHLAMVQKLTVDQQIAENTRYRKEFSARSAKTTPHGPTEYEQKLLKLNPDAYCLNVAHVDVKNYVTAARRFFDYDLQPLAQLSELGRGSIDDAMHEMVWRKEVLLDPNAYFGLAAFLREEGKNDEAAAMDRKGVAGSDDAVMAANSVCDLVMYDLAHGKKDEARAVAQNASDTGSQGGMEVEMRVLESDGKLDEAEALAKDIQDRYGYADDLHMFYVRQRDHFPDKYAELQGSFFPGGMSRAELDSFVQAPENGGRITGPRIPVKESGLQVDDIIVALDGYRVANVNQYDFIREMSKDPKMEFIVWRKDSYKKITATLANRLFHSDLYDYGSP